MRIKPASVVQRASYGVDQRRGSTSWVHKFSARVLWWQWGKSIGVKILAMYRLAPNFRWGFYDGSEIYCVKFLAMAWLAPNFWRGFYDGSEIHCVNFWPWLNWHQIFGEGFMMAVKSIIIWHDLLLYVTIWLEWRQFFGFGSRIGRLGLRGDSITQAC